MLCTTPVDQSRSRQASFSYTAHHLAVYEKRQIAQNLFIPTQCQGGSGKRKCSFTMSRLNFRDLIEQLLSSIFRPVTKREILLNTVSLFFTAKYLDVEWSLWSFGRNLPTATDFNFISQKYPRIRGIRRYLELAKSITPFGRCNGFTVG